MEGSAVPIVYPLHVNRFVRRSSIGTPVRPQSPLYLSGKGEETIMHAPRPHRSIPSIKTPPEGANLLSSGQRGYVSPVAHLHGTRKHCVRHGRHDHVRQDHGRKRKAFGGTKDMLAKSRSGAYIPTGQLERRQMEATSPWIAHMDPFQQRPGELMGYADACPDCLQELEIKRREVYQRPIRHGDEGLHSVQRPAAESSRHMYAPASHLHSTELSGAMDPDLFAPSQASRAVRGIVVYNESRVDRDFDPAWHATPYQPARPLPQTGDYGQLDDTSLDTLRRPTPDKPARPGTRQRVAQPSTSRTTTSDRSDDLVVSKALRNGLNAVIVEHQGHLRRVVLNTRSDVSEVERLQRLSRELASVSNAIAFASASRDKLPARSPPQVSVILDKMPTAPQATSSAPRAVRASSSIPELLSMIDQAAGEIHLDNSKDSGQYVKHRRQDIAATVGREQSLMHSDEMHDTLFDLPSPGQQFAYRQSMEQTMGAVEQRMAAVKEPRTAKRQAMPAGAQRATVQKLPVGSRRPVPGMGAPVLNTAPPVSKAVKQPRKDVESQRQRRSAFARSAKPVKVIPALATEESASSDPSPPSDEPTFETPPAASTAQPTQLPVPPTTARVPLAPQLQDAHPPSAATATPMPTSRALDTTPQPHHSYFPTLHLPTFNNPFHRNTPQPPSYENDSFDAIHPLLGASKALAPPPITTQANPYRHAPSIPLDLYFAQHADPGVREQAQVIRAAMRMDRKKAVQEAAAIERETRRERRESAAGTGKAGAPAAVVRKGWFG